MDQFVAATQRQVVGDPLDKDCDVGPIIDIHEAERTEQSINDSVDLASINSNTPQHIG